MQLRLIDPNGYDAVIDGYQVDAPADRVAQEVNRLMTEVAVRHAATHAYAGYRPSEYTVRIKAENAC